MNKKIILSLALASAIFAQDEAKKEEPKKEAKSLEEAFKLADVKGQIRAIISLIQKSTTQVRAVS